MCRKGIASEGTCVATKPFRFIHVPVCFIHVCVEFHSLHARSDRGGVERSWAFCLQQCRSVCESKQSGGPSDLRGSRDVVTRIVEVVLLPISTSAFILV
jgi:hypothetical protein